MTKEFRQYATNMNISVKNVLVEAHHSIEMIERYHESLRRVYSIIISKISDVAFDLALQMIFKAINDFVESNELVSTMLVFDAYSKMSESDTFSSTISQRALAMRKAMNELRKNTANRQINDALNTRNGSSTKAIHNLSLNFEVLMFREKNTGQSEA